jgi:hypothetical protein
MSGHSHGYAIFRCFFQVAVPAGAFLVLGVKQFFRFFVILMVASTTVAFTCFFIPDCLRVAEMERTVQTHGQPCGYPSGFFPMAFSADLYRPRFFAGISGFVMASDAPVMVNIHDFLARSIRKPVEFDGKSIFF